MCSLQLALPSCPRLQSTQRPCNRFLCPSTVVAWATEQWGECIPSRTAVAGPCIPTQGTQSRAVRCATASGVTVPDSMCLSSIPGVPKPSAVTLCTIEVTCSCSSDAECGSSRWVCALDTHQCECAKGWDGNGCSTPLVKPAAGSPPCDGIVDTVGGCCLGYVDSTTGRCCPDGSAVDAAGRCCLSGTVDACGTCGGNGVAVDAVGTCCTSALPPSGLCCVGAVVDSCGVCGGSNACG